MVYAWTYRRTRRPARRKHIARYDYNRCVHVDLIAFLIKDYLSVPEVVPFRLTPHFVDGMGVTGYEGVSCILRDNVKSVAGEQGSNYQCP